MVIPADDNNKNDAVKLFALLWNGHSDAELAAETDAIIRSDSERIFLFYERAEAVGLAHCSLRSDYVEGTSASPVGYLEGIFVMPGFRRSGIGGYLLKQCEEWAKGKGCTEFASDCELTNTESRIFHLKTGFSEANRIICFKKEIN